MMLNRRSVLPAALVALAVAVLVPTAVHAQSLVPAAGESEGEVRIVEKAEDAPAFGRRQVEQALKELPEDRRLQIQVEYFVDAGHSSSSNEREPYVASLVPVDQQGRKDGTEAFYEPRGQRPTQTINWKHGQKHGPEQIYNPRPHFVATEIPWKDGQIHGVRKQFNAEGVVTSEVTYKDGQIVGTARSYNEEGELVREVPYKDGQMHGQRIDYWPQTGEPRRIVPYVDGQSHGEVVEYHLNGEVKRRINVRNGQLHGHEEVFSDTGELLDERYWLEGSMVSEEQYNAAKAAEGDDEA